MYIITRYPRYRQPVLLPLPAPPTISCSHSSHRKGEKVYAGGALRATRTALRLIKREPDPLPGPSSTIAWKLEARRVGKTRFRVIWSPAMRTTHQIFGKVSSPRQLFPVTRTRGLWEGHPSGVAAPLTLRSGLHAITCSHRACGHSNP